MHTGSSVPERRGGSWQTLFPLGSADVDGLCKRLAHVTPGDLVSFTQCRKLGPANDIVTILFAAKLTEWHQQQGRVADEAATIVQDGGLLYGALLAGEHFYHQTGQKLTPDSPDAYTAALHTVHASYVELPVGLEGPWEVENWREYRHTGNYHLAYLYNEVAPRFQSHMLEHYRAQGLGDGMVSAIQNAAFYRGLIDSVIFFDAYVRGKADGTA